MPKDPRAFQAVLARLETGPHPAVRHATAWFLLDRLGEDRSRQAMRTAATEYEDLQVRWVARYAFRLAERDTATDAAGPAPEQKRAQTHGGARDTDGSVHI